MRIFSIVFLLLTWLLGGSQNFILDNFPTKDGLIYYSEVIEVDSSLSAIDIYLNAKNWLLDAFKSSKSVIQLDDKELGVITVKSYIKKRIPYSDESQIWFTLKLEMKEGRYRYSLSNVQIEYVVTITSPPVHVEEDFETLIYKAENPQSTKKWMIKANEEWKNYCEGLCKELGSDFKNIITSFKSVMSIKKDW
jgi:hypothetical protein